jgi:hypothetical protein
MPGNRGNLIIENVRLKEYPIVAMAGVMTMAK